MDDLVEGVTRGNPGAVKSVLTTVALALAVYQLVLIAVAYGKVRPPFLGGGAAGTAHRASGDAIVVLLVLVAAACLAVYGFDDDMALHAATGLALLAVLGLKIAVVRRDFGLGGRLPLLGGTVFLLLFATWATSAGGLGPED